MNQRTTIDEFPEIVDSQLYDTDQLLKGSDAITFQASNGIEIIYTLDAQGNVDSAFVSRTSLPYGLTFDEAAEQVRIARCEFDPNFADEQDLASKMFALQNDSTALMVGGVSAFFGLVGWGIESTPVMILAGVGAIAAGVIGIVKKAIIQECQKTLAKTQSTDAPQTPRFG